MEIRMPILPAQTDFIPEFSLLIGERKLSDASGGAYTHVYAANGKQTKTFALAGAEEVDLAVKAARAAFPAWRKMPADQRRNLLLAVADIIDKHADELARLSTVDNGSPLYLMQYMPSTASQQFRYYAGWADKVIGQTIETWSGPAHNYATYNPYGVIGSVIPWNGPLFAAAMVLAPALAAGNCVVLKPSEVSPFVVIRLGELLLEAGMPPGVVNVIPGGPEAGEALTRHPGIDKLQFVGSGATARRVLKTAADSLKPCGLELGGKSAIIVFEDADLEMAVGRGLAGVTTQSGQVCVAGTRLFAQRSIYDQYVKMLAASAKQIPIGDPLVSGNYMGPVVSDLSCQRILGSISKAVDQGARLVAGGERLGGDLSDGYFIPLTVLADVRNDSDISKNEVFGPVVTVTPFDSEEEAVRLANASDYGLGGYVHTTNLRRAHVVADQLDAGMIRVNGAHEGFCAATPFGGYKQSGYGRLGGLAGLHEFMQIKNVWINLADR
jgi:aldehyde dehydrogenase (NAD+)